MPNLNKHQTMVYGDLLDARAKAYEWGPESPIGAATLLYAAREAAGHRLRSTGAAELLEDLAGAEYRSMQEDLASLGEER